MLQPGKHGRFAIIAGGRRYRGFCALVDAGKLEATHQVAAKIIAADADAIELSLAENIIRAPMHPADQFEAFVAVIDQGKTIADVAARFNVTEPLVTQRLKLGRLSPAILKAYREDVIDLAQAQAFALSDDHAEQERMLAELGDHLSTYSIREALTQNEVPPTDKRVRCIGIDAYVAAGGTVRRDLFQKADSCYLQDSALLDRLVMQRLAATVNAVREEAGYGSNSARRRLQRALEVRARLCQAQVDFERRTCRGPRQEEFLDENRAKRTAEFERTKDDIERPKRGAGKPKLSELVKRATSAGRDAAEQQSGRGSPDKRTQFREQANETTRSPAGKGTTKLADQVKKARGEAGRDTPEIFRDNANDVSQDQGASGAGIESRPGASRIRGSHKSSSMAASLRHQPPLCNRSKGRDGTNCRYGAASPSNGRVVPGPTLLRRRKFDMAR